MSIGGNIKILRQQNKLTQEELGAKIGVSDKTISSWEIDRTEPNMGMIEKLASYFGCKVSDLIGDIDNKKYYLNEETRQIAQELLERKDLKILFDATRKVKPADIKYIQDLVDRLKD